VSCVEISNAQWDVDPNAESAVLYPAGLKSEKYFWHVPTARIHSHIKKLLVPMQYVGVAYSTINCLDAAYAEKILEEALPETAHLQAE
jgi:hypothetical protein